MNKVLLQVLTGFFALTLLSTTATAAVKVHGDMSHIQSVAVVGYSFLRHAQLEEASITKFKREIIQLTEDDSEYIMMQEADDRVMEALQTLGPFTVMPREEVFANEFYQSATKDPAKKWNKSWYFPKGYREVKLKKKSAIALSEALGVDAVIHIHFNNSSQTTKGSSNWGGVYSTSTKISVLKGEISMFDSTGKELISGKIKSEEVEGATTRSWGSASSGGLSAGVGVEIEGEAPDIGNVYDILLESFMERLHRELDGE